jgi:hypothetical protein
MKHLGSIACGLVFVVAGVLFVSDASSQINIRLFPQHSARHHFVYNHHPRSWAYGRVHRPAPRIVVRHENVHRDQGRHSGKR